MKASRALLAVPLLLAACGGPGGTRQETPPPLILVSIDGFRPDYLTRGITPHLTALAARGVRAPWMVPTFPSKTFPQHYTLVTGLYPARHGIVANYFVDETDGTRFTAFDSAIAKDPRWWGGEPVWVTAERQGARAATLFWPGSEYAIGGVRPSRYKPYDGSMPDSARVDTVLAWLALPQAERPRFLTLYFGDVDHWGHETGPDSPQLDTAVAAADRMIGRLVAGIMRLGLGGRVNVVVVSDHGMTATSERRLMFLEDYVDTTRVRVIDGGPLILLAARGLARDSIVTALGRAPHLRVYREGAAPAAWRYGPGPRIPDVVGVPDEGWLLVTRAALARRRNRYNGGEHGFDPAAPTQRALFLAAGPSFAVGRTVAPFTNVHVYELLCAALGLVPAPNDGSLDSVRAMVR